MSATTEPRGRTIVRRVAALGAVSAIGIYVFIAIRRMGYPFDLEWIEDTAVIEVNRVLHGNGIYVAPSVHFVPDGYPPLYFYLCAPLAAILGVGYLPLRIVSFTASLASMAILYRFVSRETSDRLAGVCAAGVFAAGYAVTGFWFDLARVDSLFLALCLGSLYVVRFATSPKGSAVAGTLMAMSFLTKQTALAVGIAAFLWLLFSGPRVTRRSHAIAFGGAFFGVIVATTALFGVLTHGWYVFYVYQVLPHQQVVAAEWSRFWTVDLLENCWPVIALLLGVVALSWRARTANARRLGGGALPAGESAERAGPPWLFYGFAAAGMLGGSWLSRVHSGGFSNVLMPMIAAVALVGTLAAWNTDTLIRASWGEASAWPCAMVWALVGAQIGVPAIGYSYAGQIPNGADVAAGRSFVHFLSEVPGNVYVPSHPYYLFLAGKPVYAHQGAVSDIVRSANGTVARRVLIASIERAVQHHEFSLVVLDSAFDDIAIPADFDRYYAACPRFLFPGVPIGVFHPRTDLYDRPHQMFVPAGSAACSRWPLSEAP